jgi:rhodanese-related sulfurtransferase
LFLDARSPDLYREGHIQGARNLPWESFDDFFDPVMKDVPRDAFIVAYCDGEGCSLSEEVAKDLLSIGYENVRVLFNGWTRWTEAGLPVEKGDGGHSDGRKG